MPTIDYADPVKPRAVIDPVPERVYDPAPLPLNSVGEERAAQIARDAEASRAYPRPASIVSPRSFDREIPAFSTRGFSSLDVAATVVAALMTIGPLFGGYITNMHS